MTALKVEIEPAEVGLSSDRLHRIGGRLRRYVDDGLLPGWLVLVSRRGKIAYLETYGQRDLESGHPIETDTIFRIYSMTKPITSVAAMMLHEQGAFELKDPVANYIPAFRDMRVFRSGSLTNPAFEAATEPVRIWHLLTHTAGLTYGFLQAHPVDAMYRQAGFELGAPTGLTLAECVDRWAALPLLFQPGAEWNYSVATDVLGRLVEVVSGTTLDRFFADRIFGPLGMTDTAFAAEGERARRLAALYIPNPVDRRAMRSPNALNDVALSQPAFLSGGGGLVSTAADYHRFTQMILGGGELEGVRLLGPRTVAYMGTNHLPGGADLSAFGRPLFSESQFDGNGFGLGFSVVIDPAAAKVPCSLGEMAWGGAASTAFWIDPSEELTVVFLTQLLPSSTHPLRSQLRQLVYQSLVD